MGLSCPHARFARIPLLEILILPQFTDTPPKQLKDEQWQRLYLIPNLYFNCSSRAEETSKLKTLRVCHAFFSRKASIEVGTFAGNAMFLIGVLAKEEKEGTSVFFVSTPIVFSISRKH